MSFFCRGIYELLVKYQFDVWDLIMSVSIRLIVELISKLFDIGNFLYDDCKMNSIKYSTALFYCSLFLIEDAIQRLKSTISALKT